MNHDDFVKYKEKVMKAVLNGKIIANSKDTVVVEGNHYFPLNSVDKSVLSDSDKTTTCHWKGEAYYYNVTVDGKKNENAAFYYPHPSEAAREIEEHVAFWHGIEVVD
jgi:uncharacterized protein (DUF427 family)